jgi:hypothetical protein
MPISIAEFAWYPNTVCGFKYRKAGTTAARRSRRLVVEFCSIATGTSDPMYSEALSRARPYLPES